ncbi:hypothetical protein HPB52_000095 [Rhipicephalus sanguineus]|uniref:Fucosyltransferase N-terminal domain-containing protein n=1 Tax=Rhipicephalus sanguineus TaxID=34632 RepID=A0A9D4PT96_RHISA|nr:hypothetical protein HPB52_000095 [Rhipicephalus sanguineus]
MKQTDLQVLPDCGASQCKSPTDCVAQIAKKFKFIVVASTPACFESVGDLVYEAFKHDIVPVVLAPPNFKLTAFGNSMEMLRELVRSVVREELQKQRLGQSAPMLSSTGRRDTRGGSTGGPGASDKRNIQKCHYSVSSPVCPTPMPYCEELPDVQMSQPQLRYSTPIFAMADAANQDDVPEPQPLPEYQRRCITGAFLVGLAVLAVQAGSSAYSCFSSPPSLSPPPILEMTSWIEWQYRYYGDAQIPRILIWTGSPSGNSSVYRVEKAAKNAACNFTDGHYDGGNSSLLPCSVTHDRSLLMESDAIVFHVDLVNVSDLPRKRASNQLWVFWARTHPAIPTPVDGDLEEAISHVEGTGKPSSLPLQLWQFFNWTMAHREDAVVRIAHKSFVPGFPSTADMLSSTFIQSPPLAMVKRRDAAWIASTCELEKFKKERERSRRDKVLVDVLGDLHDLDDMKQTDLQVLPDCGASQCKSPTDCVAQIAKKFKFIVVASTPACFESVGDLVYEAFKHDIVPVVLAPPNFKLSFPPKSVEQPKRMSPPALDYREWWERRVRCRAEALFDVGTFRKEAHALP